MDLAKCACYLLIWKFQEDGYAYTETPETLDKNINVQDLNKTTTTIQQLPATASQKLLGVMRNPIGNQQDKYNGYKTRATE
jgi:hypothetical protein